MAGPVKIKVDLTAGTIKIEAEAENIDAVFDRLDSFIPRFSEAYETSTRKSAQPDVPREIEPLVASEPNETVRPSTSEQKPEVRKSVKGSKSKEVYTSVDLGLSESQRGELRAFFAEKKPKGQKEQMAVLMDWLKRVPGKPSVSWNDIFTAFRTVGAKCPGKISSVLGNMVGSSWVRNVGAGQYELLHVGEDYVKFDLPKKDGDKG